MIFIEDHIESFLDQISRRIVSDMRSISKKGNSLLYSTYSTKNVKRGRAALQAMAIELGNEQHIAFDGKFPSKLKRIR